MKLDDIEKLLAAASPGPWGEVRLDERSWHKAGVHWSGPETAEDCAFIAASRQLMPKLLKVAKALKYVRDIGDYANDRDWSAVDQAIADLEQP